MKINPIKAFAFCFIASTVALISASCGSSKEAKAREDSIQQARIDSINQAKLDSIREDSIRRNRVTPDLALFELKGPVKSVNRNFISLEFDGGANFDTDGNIISLIPGPNGMAKFKRASDGKITKFSSGHKSEKISYNKDLQPLNFSWIFNYGECSSKNRSCTYTNGNLSSYYEKQQGVEGSWHESRINASYTYIEYDDYGNWTKRQVNIVDRNTNENETQDGEETRTLRSSKTQTRVITYYE